MGDYGLPADGKPSRFYHYPDAIFNPNISTQTREFLHACWTDVEKVKDMLDSSCSLHQANANGFTGLHMAASKFKLDVVMLLLDRGHDVNIEECNGLTPLDYCVDSGIHGQAGVTSETSGNRPFMATVDLLQSYGGLRREERRWLKAANTEAHAPNMPSA